jgi:hypothetical protein
MPDRASAERYAFPAINVTSSETLGGERRPVVVVEGAPDRISVVEHDRMRHVHRLHGAAHALPLAFERELGRVCTYDHQSVIAVRLRPSVDVRQGADPVDAGVGAELDGDDAPAQAGGRQRLGIQPGARPVECGERRQSLPPNRFSARRKMLKTSRKIPAAIGTAASGFERRRRLKSKIV